MKLAKCDTCGYTGKKGLWRGTYTIKGKTKDVKGVVILDTDGETWDCDKIMPKEIDSFDGMCYCPKCNSIDFD